MCQLSRSFVVTRCLVVVSGCLVDIVTVMTFLKCTLCVSILLDKRFRMEAFNQHVLKHVQTTVSHLVI